MYICFVYNFFLCMSQKMQMTHGTIIHCSDQNVAFNYFIVCHRSKVADTIKLIHFMGKLCMLEGWMSYREITTTFLYSYGTNFL